MRRSYSLLNGIASIPQIVATDLTNWPVSPSLVDGLSPPMISAQETFFGSTSLEETRVDC
jgi:hypothetical protein